MSDFRTPKQNRALHKWCTEVAVELNGKGVTVSTFVKDLEADFSMETVKMMWRAFAKAKYGKESTTQLTKKQINEIYEECNRHLAKFEIHLPFPSEEFIEIEERARPQMESSENRDRSNEDL